MLLIVIALLWVALLTPMAVRRLRDRGTERSIESFHTEHEVLSRQGYAVAPAHRLSEPAPTSARTSRLTVVHADDTYRSLESRRSWEEWSEDYDYDGVEAPAAPVNRYAHAYAAVPRDEEYARVSVAPRIARRSARAQRRLIFSSLIALAVVTTGGAFLVSSSLAVDAAIVAWVALAGYVSLALYAVSAGYLDESSLGMRRRAAPLATVRPLYREAPIVEDDEPYGYDESPDADWRRSSSRYALG